jgi:NAD(P)-dependent dehydrogenase (short-subunit alcohol dehydrogenase family)
VVITGGTGGIGLATATALAATGARLVWSAATRPAASAPSRPSAASSAFVAADLGLARRRSGG